MRAAVPAITLTLAAAGLFALPAPRAANAQDQTLLAAQSAHPRHHPSVRRHRPRYDADRGVGQIACTPIGCVRIPPNCHPTTAYYPDGTPTGYDAVACR